MPEQEPSFSVLKTRTRRVGNFRSIGAILIDNGILAAEDAERVLHYQKKHGLRFGDAAVKLGLLSKADVQKALSQQYDYPYLMTGNRQVSDEVVAAYSPFSPLVEQLRVLRSQLMLRWFDSTTGRQALTIASPESGEGRSFIAANLAVVFSQLGERTLLIDADMRHPCQHHLFRLDNKQGLSSLLAGRAHLAAAVKRVEGLLGLSILPAGPLPPNPLELLSRSTFQALLDAAKKHFDIMIVDSPPGNDTADAQATTVATQGALILARRNVTSIASLQALTHTLQHSGGIVVGSLLNNG
ncbi:MAG: chain length determinant protein tyrosine kinase EpsG [Zoogloeaceae bacterium]|jgi:receptor protein-tyrosine kinase|nr:chain length determinant protein tyrosine kinase EpsG [Zoogloeaceae bacterium]